MQFKLVFFNAYFIYLSHCPVPNEQLKIYGYKNKRPEKIIGIIKINILSNN